MSEADLAAASTLAVEIIREIGPERRPGRLVLQVHDGDTPGAHTLEGAVVTVGRSALADLSVADESISGLHFEVRVNERGAAIRDLGSTNGLWLAERRVEGVQLHVGDWFRAGSVRFTLGHVDAVDVEVLILDRYGRLEGACVHMRELYTEIARLAPTRLDVLVLGETGTGKERAAETIHKKSKRSGPLVILNCATLSASLAEAELFGVRKGAYTGAHEDRVGLFEAAEGGTLFLDEIGELSLDLQASARSPGSVSPTSAAASSSTSSRPPTRTCVARSKRATSARTSTFASPAR